MTSDLSRRAFLIGTGCAAVAAPALLVPCRHRDLEKYPHVCPDCGTTFERERLGNDKAFRVFAGLEMSVVFGAGIAATQYKIANHSDRPLKAPNGMTLAPGQTVEWKDNHWVTA